MHDNPYKAPLADCEPVTCDKMKPVKKFGQACFGSGLCTAMSALAIAGSIEQPAFMVTAICGLLGLVVGVISAQHWWEVLRGSECNLPE